MKRVRRKISFGPITVMILIGVVISIFSFILQKIGFQSTVTDPETLETTVVTVRNIFSVEGLRYIIGNSISNFRALEPLAVIVVSLIAVTILEVSGLFHSALKGFQGVRPWTVTFITLLISMASTVLGDYSYALLFPLIAIIYKYLNRDPKLGIMTVFIGITMGYGASFLYSYQDVVLGAMAEEAAFDVLSTYQFGHWSMIFMEIAAAFILTIAGTFLIEKNLVRKVRRTEEKEGYKIINTITKRLSYYILVIFV